MSVFWQCFINDIVNIDGGKKRGKRILRQGAAQNSEIKQWRTNALFSLQKQEPIIQGQTRSN